MTHPTAGPSRRPRLLTVVLTAGTVLSLSAAPAPAQPEAGLSGRDCVSKAEKKRITKGTGKRGVRRLLGSPGVKVRKKGRVEVRRFLACGGGKHVLVKYRNGRVVSVKARRADGTAPTGSRPSGTKSRLVPADIDGNGTRDYWFDPDSDGYYEVAVLDANGNGVFESVFVEGATIQGIFLDQNENGYFEAAAFDSDKDGNANWLVVDQNEDGVADQTMVDLVGADGIADTWVPASSPSSYNPPRTSAQQAREANDMMVAHIVTMNQLRQFDPWSTAYVPDGTTPSLLLP